MRSPALEKAIPLVSATFWISVRAALPPAYEMTELTGL
jgi:hypothetical protein